MLTIPLRSVFKSPLKGRTVSSFINEKTRAKIGIEYGPVQLHGRMRRTVSLFHPPVKGLIQVQIR